MLAMTASASGSTTAAFVIGYIPYLPTGIDGVTQNTGIDDRD